MELHEKIAAMREYITEHGHCKFKLRSADGRVCLTEAMVKTPPQNFNQEDVQGFLCRLAIELELVEPTTIFDVEDGAVYRIEYGPMQATLAFNNHPDTTESDVIEFLRTAEIKAKELL